MEKQIESSGKLPNLKEIAADVAWIAEVREVRLPLDATLPIMAREFLVKKGNVAAPYRPHPEQHPYYEISIMMEGHLISHIGTEKIRRCPGSLMMIGPEIPHHAFHQDYPARGYVVHFLPILLLEMGPQGDGARILSRFVASQKITDRIFPAPKHLRAGLTRRFEAMAKEFREKKSCWEIHLRALLMETLTEIYRWEETTGRLGRPTADDTNWLQMEKSLRFIHENFARPFYVEEMANAVGLSVDRLQVMFRNAFGAGCMHYLLSYRIAQAKALLYAPGTRINEVALNVGFTRLSHFNATFRRLTGASPTEFMKKKTATLQKRFKLSDTPR